MWSPPKRPRVRETLLRKRPCLEPLRFLARTSFEEEFLLSASLAAAEVDWEEEAAATSAAWARGSGEGEGSGEIWLEGLRLALVLEDDFFFSLDLEDIKQKDEGGKERKDTDKERKSKKYKINN